MNSPYTTLGLPPDGVAWAALALSVLLTVALHTPNRRVLGTLLTQRRLVPLLAGSAGLLSVGYVTHYLHSGPRIIDATSYFLQARALAHGYFDFPVPLPYGSFLGRFLVASGSHALSVIFPPGYPALLAVGFLVHAPLLVGPVIGSLTVLATYALARQSSGRSDVACVAASLSTVCAALRYHTADTMSHGLCALLFCVCAFTALRGARWDALFCGLAGGWLLATRPVSGAVGVLLALCLLDRSLRRISWFVVGLMPGILLWLVYQRAATGSYFGSAQLTYYALADGPPGCFRYGFGRGIGCLHEHGQYVRARLSEGYGLREAASVTLRRLAVHSIDIGNAAPLSLLCFVGAWFSRRQRAVRLIFFACLGLILAYAPFYFDASYPGGGARLFADLLPLEHVLLAIALVRLDWYALALPLSLLGFACHASFAHRALSEREGGSPMFEPEVLTRAGINHGLVFVDTDHGFNLGHDPGQLDAERHIVVARLTHDAHDWFVWNQLNRPASYRYVYSVSGGTGRTHAEVVSYTPAGEPQRFEAEAEWPLLLVQDGWVLPDFYPCASGGRALRVEQTGQRAAVLGVELVSPNAGRSHLRLGWIRSAGPQATISLVLADGPTLSSLIPGGPTDCIELDLGMVELPRGATRVRLASSSPGWFDYIDVRP